MRFRWKFWKRDAQEAIEPQTLKSKDVPARWSTYEEDDEFSWGSPPPGVDVRSKEFADTILNSDLPPEVIEPVITDEWLEAKDEWLGWAGPLETNGYEEDWNYG